MYPVINQDSTGTFFSDIDPSLQPVGPVSEERVSNGVLLKYRFPPDSSLPYNPRICKEIKVDGIVQKEAFEVGTPDVGKTEYVLRNNSEDFGQASFVYMDS